MPAKSETLVASSSVKGRDSDDSVSLEHLLDNLPPGVKLSSAVLEVPTHLVRRMEDQPRRWFNPATLADLRASITKAGQQQPALIVAVTNNGRHRYELVSGERRWRVCSDLGIPLKAILVEVNDRSQQFILSCICNFGEEQEPPMEVAWALKRIKAESGLTDEEIAQRFGKSIGWVWQHLKLNQLDSEVQELMHPSISEKKRLKLMHALLLINLSPGLQRVVAKNIVSKRMRMAQARSYVTRTAAKMGESRHIRNVEPFQVRRRFIGALDVIEAKLAPFVSLTPTDLQEMFGQGKADSPVRMIDNVVERLEHIRQDLVRLTNTLRTTRTNIARGRVPKRGCSKD